MTSFGAKTLDEPGFMPTFTVQGQVYHLAGSLLPMSDQPPQFLQIYFMGEDQANYRCGITPAVRENIVHELQTLLNEHNRYVQSFRTVAERLAPQAEELRVIIRAEKRTNNEHPGRFNAPPEDEVAIQIVGQQFERRDIVLQLRSNTLQRINETHRSYDSLQYPLILWQGEDGYDIDVRQVDPQTGVLSETKKVSAMCFYAYRLMVREGSFNIILRCRKLYLQFAVDMYAKVETERLQFIRHNQIRLRAVEYIHLRDAIAGERDPTEIGQMVVLPSRKTP
ncbi:hypothetical protein ElyMa_005489700 [Elysia marginata]|uniref:Helitron helicase-like domain-containing protein n=1 Tax=Elysia marginata TaxID=1093978 RepID=A0AAV4ETK8_9GAST|nr:hypothetical protein ElyMa_005489700 [Elysia marginata]